MAVYIVHIFKRSIAIRSSLRQFMQTMAVHADHSSSWQFTQFISVYGSPWQFT